MTSTVAQLFTINRSSHLKFFKNSSQLNESKIDIPIGRGSTSNLNNPLNESQIVTNAADWVSTQGKKFLEEAKERLQIDTKTYLFKDKPLQTLTYEELNKVKRNVKNELKKYDQTFIHLFFRQPAKTDKEPLRPLYMYYKKLKTLITNYSKNQAIKAQQNGADNRSGAQQVQGGVQRSNSMASNSSNTSKLTYTTNGSTYGSSRENSVTNQSLFGSTNGSQSNQLTIQDLNLNGGLNKKQGPNQEQQIQIQGQRQQSYQQQNGKQQMPQQEISKQQQQRELNAINGSIQNNTKFNERKNSTGSAQMNQNGQGILTQLEKDSQGRLMGVRGSVELKSINSVGGPGIAGAGLGQGQQNGNNVQLGSGFAWTQSSKNQPQSQKSNSIKQQSLDQNFSGNQQLSKNDMMNVRKSAQAVTMSSLLDNTNQQNMGYGNQMQYQHQQQQQYHKGSSQQQQQQQLYGKGQQHQQMLELNNQGRYHQVSSSQTQINFYPLYQQQQTMGNERKENTNPFNFEEPKVMTINGQLNQQQMVSKKDKRPQSASSAQQMVNQGPSQQQQVQNAKMKEQKDLMLKIEDFKKERGGLRTKLDLFRKQFEQTYNRKIKFKRDIKEVESEFKRYKDLKDDIHKLEKQLQKLQQ